MIENARYKLEIGGPRVASVTAYYSLRAEEVTEIVKKKVEGFQLAVGETIDITRVK